MPFANGMHNFSKYSSAPMHFNFGKRMLNIIYTKLSHNCILNYDLCRKNIADTHNCSCGKQEDAYHFFFICKRNSNARYIMFDKLFAVVELSFVDTHTLLWGQKQLCQDINRKFFPLFKTFLVCHIDFPELSTFVKI